MPGIPSGKCAAAAFPSVAGEQPAEYDQVRAEWLPYRAASLVCRVFRLIFFGPVETRQGSQPGEQVVALGSQQLPGAGKAETVDGHDNANKHVHNTGFGGMLPQLKSLCQLKAVETETGQNEK